MWALVPLLRIVRLQVSHLGGGVGESFVAEVAVVRFLPAVHQLVALQIPRGGEKLAADVAAVPRFTHVPFPMEVEQADLAVALPTGGAAIRLQGTKRETAGGV